MKTIKIFLASSDELENDRMAFGDLVRRLDTIYEKRGYRIELIKWEDLDAAYNDMRKQDEYNEQIKASDLFLALFHTRAGEFTIEEFDVAVNEYQRSKISPKVYVYCKDLQPGEIESQELIDFKKRLFKELGHYWCRYGNRDTMQLHFVMQLQLMESSDMEDLKVEDNGIITLEGMTVAYMDKLPFASNNNIYQSMSKQLHTLQVEIKKAEADLENDSNNENLQKELQLKREHFSQLKEDFSTLQKKLVAIAKTIADLQQHQVSDRTHRAIEAFECGDLKLAIDLLKENESEGDLLAQQINSDHQRLHEHIDSLLLETNIVMADVSTLITERITYVVSLFDKADKWARLYHYDKKKYAKLLLEYVLFLNDYNLYKLAKEKSVCERLINAYEEAFGKDDIETAKAYNNVGNLCLDLDELDEAHTWYSKSLTIYIQQFGEDHPAVGVIYNNIGNVFSAKHDMTNALEYRLKAMKVITKTEPESALLSAIYNNIANCYFELHNYDDALKYHQMALNIRKKVYGENSRDVACSYANIGSVLQEQGQFDNAIIIFEKALGIRKAVLGLKHADTASSYINIGNIYEIQNKSEEALKYYSKALSIYKELYGLNHTKIANAYTQIGNVYRDRNYKDDYENALEYYNKALTILLDRVGAEDKETAILYHSIGIVYSLKNEFADAFQYMQMALRIQENHYEEDNFDLARTYQDIGNIYFKIYETGYDNSDVIIINSLEYLRKAITILEGCSGLEQRNLAYCYQTIGALHYLRKDFDGALSYFCKALSIIEMIFGSSSQESLSLHNNIGSVYSSQENYVLALKQYNEALKICKEQLEENNLETAKCYGLIGNTYQSMDDFSNAVINYELELAILENNNHPDTEGLREQIEMLRIFIDEPDIP